MAPMRRGRPRESSIPSGSGDVGTLGLRRLSATGSVRQAMGWIIRPK